MFQQFTYSEQLPFIQKIKRLDIWLILCILVLGIIGTIAMYSSDGGQFSFYTKNHIIRFMVFFLMMLVFSFIRIKFWHTLGYFFYFVVVLLLIYAFLYGITASGSQRWINLYFINLQPSELMKVSLIVFLARYYNKIPSQNVNSIKPFQ